VRPGLRTLALTGLLSATAAAVGARGVRTDTVWYRTLDKPPWQPPPLAFPLVWTPLYAAIAYGTARMIDAEEADRSALWSLVSADLAVNAAWGWAFFERESPAGGLGVILALDGLNIALVRAAWRRDRGAAAALLPYAAWTAFATALNTELWRRNP
jgi:tryptophan-rich sensory protein